VVSGCLKCKARAYWLRRKAWRCRKSTALRQLLARATADGAPRGRHRRSGNPEPSQEPDRLSAAQAAGAAEAGINLYLIYIRNAHARQMIDGFAATMPSLDGLWLQVDRALADVPALAAVIARLTAELTGARLDQASLVAAIRTALAPRAEGESDPLSQLSDALDRLQALPEVPGGDRDDA
jgi:hypothetical protein